MHAVLLFALAPLLVSADPDHAECRLYENEVSCDYIDSRDELIELLPPIQR